MKKLFPTVVDESARGCPMILFSGGRIGLQVEIRPSDLEKIIPIKYADIVE
jgi:Cys-tRNA(Pro)/Cys-tRNA(Cys) deacylase